MSGATKGGGFGLDYRVFAAGLSVAVMDLKNSHDYEVAATDRTVASM